MKQLLTILAITCATLSFSQNVNWNSNNESQNHITYLNFGYDFGITTQVGYGYKLNTFKSILLSTDYSFPMGKNLVDDFKFRIGTQIPIYQKNKVVFSGKAYSAYKRHETSFVRMATFSCEFSAMIGYYKTNWHLAGEFGFDKSINTHLKHSELMKENFAAIKDGWVSNSAGHFFYGIQGGKSIKEKIEISLRLGGTNAQGKDENALLPYYAQLGLIYKFSSKKNVGIDLNEL